MPRQKQHGHLIDQLFKVKRLACLRIFGLHKGSKNIFGLFIHLATLVGLIARQHHGAKQAANFLGCLVTAPAVPWQRCPTHAKQRGQHQLGGQCLIARKRLEDPQRIRPLHGLRENRAEDDVCRHMRHLHFNVMGLAIRHGLQPLEQSL